MAHRCAEWDGWEEGLVDSILGPEEFEHEWFKVVSHHVNNGKNETREWSPRCADSEPSLITTRTTTTTTTTMNCRGNTKIPLPPSLSRIVKISSKLPLLQEQEKEQMLNTTGDICGGRGGELGRRLEAWLTVNGHVNGNGNVDHAESEEEEEEEERLGGVGAGG